MKKTSNSAFTLIELLVVITIIGILATGAVAVYTSQIQKGRDATRITSINALKGGIEQYYQDDSDYPSTGTGFAGVKAYVPNLPKDPKSDQATTYTALEYAYNVGEDGNGIDNQIYEVSTGLENTGNIKAKAGTGADGGNDPYRLEIGIILTGSGELNTAVTPTAGAAVATWISGSPTGDICVNATVATDCSNPNDPLVIK